MSENQALLMCAEWAGPIGVYFSECADETLFCGILYVTVQE